MVEAQWLFLLTDVDALYTSNPRTDPTAQPIRVVEDMEALRQTGTPPRRTHKAQARTRAPRRTSPVYACKDTHAYTTDGGRVQWT
jgi:uridylate kinase